MNFNFSKKSRLLTAKQFDRVFSKGYRVFSGRYFVLLACPNALDYPRLGLVIGKKAVGNAIRRNRVKRAIRESFRLNQDNLGAFDVVVIARKGLGELSSTDLSALFVEKFSHPFPQRGDSRG